jgi:hypothetical protein
MRLEQAISAMRRAGAKRVYLKDMARNDNSKNQYYVGGGETALWCLDLTLDGATVSGEGRRTAMGAGVDLRWITERGTVPAPYAKIIFYPQYPEVRLSGIVRGVPAAVPGRDLARDRADGRVMLLGPASDHLLIWIGEPEGRERYALRLQPTGKNPLQEVLPDSGRSPLDEAWDDLLEELGWFVARGPVPSQKLSASGLVPYSASINNAAGYTLEALFGIEANSSPEPDYRGLIELKVAGSKISLVTPEPNGGVYGEQGSAAFLHRWGATTNGKLRFTGTHHVAVSRDGRSLTLRLLGWSPHDPSRYDPLGVLALVDDDGTIAASWSLAGLHTHWLQKHPEVAFVPYIRDKASDTIQFLNPVRSARGTSFPHFLQALHDGHVHLDPGTSMDPATERVHARNQLRIYRTKLAHLYENFTSHDV